MPESQAQNPAATEPTANPEEEIQAKKAAAVELNGNEVKNGHDEESRDTNGDDVDEQDEVDEADEDEDDAADQAVENTDVEANGKQSRKRVSDVNGSEGDELNGSDDVVTAKKPRTEPEGGVEAEEGDKEESGNAIKADGDA